MYFLIIFIYSNKFNQPFLEKILGKCRQLKDKNFCFFKNVHLVYIMIDQRRLSNPIFILKLIYSSIK